MENLKYNLGVVEDPRTEEEKSSDYQHEELAGGTVVSWIEKSSSELKRYIPREQDGSLSCCAQSAAKAYETLMGTVMSAHPPYRSRANYPEGGMYLKNLGDIWKNLGSTTEAKDTSQWQNESLMNRTIVPFIPNKVGAYVMVNPTDIDAIAEAIELHKHCMLLVHCAHSEWTAEPVYNGAPVDFGHCVCAVDYFLHNGVKKILIEDSTGHPSSLDGDGARRITSDFLKKRFNGAMYFVMDTPPIPEPPTSHTFTKILKFGMQDPEVVFLQDTLKHQGLFPSAIPSSGKFLQITKNSVIKFQKAHNLVADGVVGPKTNEKLNELH